MKAKMLLDGERPKVDPRVLKGIIENAGMRVTSGSADLGIVVGGDGVFGKYGRTESVPLLFVGVRSNKATGSKAYLAATYFEELPSILRGILEGAFKTTEYKRLEVFRNGRSLGEVFTDVYLERGAESNCVRYKVRVNGGQEKFEEAAIGNGIVISTSAGSTGYFSYLDRIAGNEFNSSAITQIPLEEVGICHIAPTYVERSGSSKAEVRYRVPWGSRIELALSRPADARLYGVETGRGGIRVSTKDKLVIVPGRHTTKVVTVQ